MSSIAVCSKFFYSGLGDLITSMSIDLNICIFLQLRNLRANNNDTVSHSSSILALVMLSI